MKAIFRPFLFTLLICIFCSAATVSAQDAVAFQQKLASKYQNMTSMSAEFVQVTSSAFLESSERFSGTLQLAGDKYRVQTGSQTIVTDGVTLWIHNRAEQQVIINTYENDASSFSLTTFLGQIGQYYTLALDGSVTKAGVLYDVVTLRPFDQDAQFRSVLMHVRRSDTVVTHLQVVDLNDVEMTFDLSKVNINAEMPSSTFTFVIPSGVEVIDLRN